MSARTEVVRRPSVPATAARPDVGPRGRLRLTARAAILAVLVVSIGLVSIVPVRDYLTQRDRVARLEAQADRLAEQNIELQGEIDELHDPAYLERLARECLGMVRPGEIAFVTVGGEHRDPIC